MTVAVQRRMVVIAWLATRLLLILAVAHPNYLGTHAHWRDDVNFYHDWARQTVDGHWPRHDPQWQYPPVAMGLFMIPLALPGEYLPVFVALMLLVDAAVLWCCFRAGSNTFGLWVWVLVPLLLGPISYTRFDLLPTLFAVVGLTFWAKPVLSGISLAVGGWVKVWPATLLLDQRDRRRTRAVLAAIGVSGFVVVSLAVTGQLAAAFSFLSEQKARGLQIESVAATPFMVLNAVRGGSLPRYEYGAFQVTTTGASVVAVACSVAGLAVLASYLAITLRMRHEAAWSTAVDPATLALTVVLLLMLTSRVLSPQYLVWPIGLCAVACQRVRTPSLRRSAVLLAAGALLTQAVYPFAYTQVTHNRPIAVLILLLRNVVLLVAAAELVRGIVRGLRAGSVTSAAAGRHRPVRP